MELIQQYIDLQPIIVSDREELGLCTETLFNPHQVNMLRAHAKPHTVEVYIDGIMQQQGRSYMVSHNHNGTTIHFVNENHETLLNRTVQVTYDGYRMKGDRDYWN